MPASPRRKTSSYSFSAAGVVTILSFLLVVGSGCSSSMQYSASSVGGSASIQTSSETDEILRKIGESLERRRSGVQALRGRGTLFISSPDWNGASRVNTIILARRPSQLRMRGLTPFSTAFDVLSGPERFYLHLPSESEVWTGPAAQLGSLTGLPIVPEDVVAALFAEPFGELRELRILRYDHSRVEVEWRLESGERAVGVFERSRMLPSELSIIRKGEKSLILKYTDYLLEPDGWWPRGIRLHWPQEHARLHVDLHEIELNPNFKEGSFEFSPPQDVQWYEYDGDEVGAARSNGEY